MKYFVVVFILFICIPVCAQSGNRACSFKSSYVNRNFVDPPEVVLSQIEGQITDPQRAEIPGACVSLYSEKSRTLVAEVQADDNGRFQLPKVPPGDYRLVVQVEHDYLCPANAKIKVASKQSGRSKKKLSVEMIPTAIDTCSSVEAK